MSKIHINTTLDDLQVTLALNKFTSRELKQAIKDERAGQNRISVIDLLSIKLRKVNYGHLNVKNR